MSLKKRQINKMYVARLKKGYSEIDMAKILKTSQTKISRTESKPDYKADPDLLERISILLDVPVGELYDLPE